MPTEDQICHYKSKPTDIGDEHQQTLKKMSPPHFLEIPLEIRLIVYNLLLQDHQIVKQKRQPNNSHILILHTCTQIYYEADHIFRQYVSLRREKEMLNFYHLATDTQKAQIRWADVANDGRSIEDLTSNYVSSVISAGATSSKEQYLR